MFKLLVLTLALFSVVLAETTFKKVDLERIQPGGFSSNGAPFAVDLTDKGGNWGDNIWGERKQGDSLISREIQVNTKPLNQIQQFDWAAHFPGKSINHIRFFNIGRQRAIITEVTAKTNGGPDATAKVLIAPNKSFRILVEVFAK